MKITDSAKNMVALSQLEDGMVYKSQSGGIYMAGDEEKNDCRIVMRLDNGIVGRHHNDSLVTPLPDAEMFV